MTQLGPNFMTPQSELFASLQDHYSHESSLTLLIEKLSDQECIDLDKAIQSRAGYMSDMAMLKPGNLEGIMQ